TAISHYAWCPEMQGTGRCNCNPDIYDLETREYSGIGDGKLTCKVCEEFSIGEVILYGVVEDGDGYWERFWIKGGDMFYWLVGIKKTEFRFLICHLCMIDLGIEFPNGIEDNEDWGDDQLN